MMSSPGPFGSSAPVMHRRLVVTPAGAETNYRPLERPPDELMAQRALPEDAPNESPFRHPIDPLSSIVVAEAGRRVAGPRRISRRCGRRVARRS